MNKDRVILEKLYVEMAYGFAEGSKLMNIQQMMDLLVIL